MIEDRDIEVVTQRLRAALDALEAAAERQLDADDKTSSLADQIHALSVDRSRPLSIIRGRLPGNFGSAGSLASG